MYQGIIPSIKELLALRYYATKIDLFNRKRVNQIKSGSNLSHARGRGMDFEEVRAYQPYDDIRLIHWSLTARLGKPYTKIYKEERERAVYLLINQSQSMKFGTKVCFKNVLAAKLAAIFGFATLNCNDQIGGIIFNDQNAEFIKPNRSRKSLLQMLNTLSNANAIKSNNGGLDNTLKFMLQRAQSGSTIIVISDFYNFTNDTDAYLKLLAQKSQVINVLVYDQLEEKLPGNGQFNFSDNGKKFLQINWGKKSNELYAKDFSEKIEKLETLSRKNNMQFIKVATNDDIVKKVNYSLRGIK